MDVSFSGFFHARLIIAFLSFVLSVFLLFPLPICIHFTFAVTFDMTYHGVSS